MIPMTTLTEKSMLERIELFKQLERQCKEEADNDDGDEPWIEPVHAIKETGQPLRYSDVPIRDLLEDMQIQASGCICLAICDKIFKHVEGLKDLLYDLFSDHPRTEKLRPDDLLRLCLRGGISRSIASCFTYSFSTIPRSESRDYKKVDAMMKSSSMVSLDDASIHFLVSFCDHYHYDVIMMVWGYKLNDEQIIEELSFFNRLRDDSTIVYNFRDKEVYYPHACTAAIPVLSELLPMDCVNTEIVHKMGRRIRPRPVQPKACNLANLAAIKAAVRNNTTH